MGFWERLKGQRQPKAGDYLFFHGEQFTLEKLSGRTFTAYRKINGKIIRPSGNRDDLRWEDRVGAWYLPGVQGPMGA